MGVAWPEAAKFRTGQVESSQLGFGLGVLAWYDAELGRPCVG